MRPRLPVALLFLLALGCSSERTTPADAIVDGPPTDGSVDSPPADLSGEGVALPTLPRYFEARAQLSYPDGKAQVGAPEPDSVDLLVAIVGPSIPPLYEVKVGVICRQSGDGNAQETSVAQATLERRADGGYRIVKYRSPAGGGAVWVKHCAPTSKFYALERVAISSLELELDETLSTLSGRFEGALDLYVRAATVESKITGIISGARDTTAPSLHGGTSIPTPLAPIVVGFDEPVIASATGATIVLSAPGGELARAVFKPSEGAITPAATQAFKPAGHWPLNEPLTLEISGVVDLAGQPAGGQGKLVGTLPAIAAPSTCTDLGFEGSTDPVCGCAHPKTSVAHITAAQGARFCESPELATTMFATTLPAGARRLTMQLAACADEAVKTGLEIIVASPDTRAVASIPTNTVAVSGAQAPCQFAADWRTVQLDVSALAGKPVIVRLRHQGATRFVPSRLLYDDIRVESTP
ncbi:MAG: hypothetical protein KC503_18360 [Myxococcales bacterium]|nr:hypothetical protein [Myxococcales bacterium]